MEHGASFEDINNLKQTALHCAVCTKSSSRMEIVKFLSLEKGQNPNSVDVKGRTPVDMAELEVMQILLENGGNPNVVNYDGYTPLHIMLLWMNRVWD